MEHRLEPSGIPRYPNLELLARSVVEGFIVGLHKSPFHGFSVEFSEHRLYNPGEPTRHIDWKLYGRTDKLFVKRFEEETNLRCQLVIDNSSSMYFPVLDNATFEKPDKITFAVYTAAALMNLLRRQRDACGLSILSRQVDLHTASRSNAVHHKFLLGRLEQILTPPMPGEKRESNLASGLHYVSENIHRRSLVVVFSDMFDSSANDEALFDALRHLRYNKHEVILFHLSDKGKEMDFEFENRPYRFVDTETGEELRLQPSEVKALYVKQMKQWFQNLSLKCAQYGIDFVEADIARGFDQVLLPYLLKREKMM